MNISNRVHQIRIDFAVTEKVKRYVFIYLIEGKYCYLIDSGVAGNEAIIKDYLKAIGRDISELKWIFLTHAHPDHIGSAAMIQKISGCRVGTSEGEKWWIEDIDLQFKQRPIPNFYHLVDTPARVTDVLAPGQDLTLEPGLTIRCHDCSGHSIQGIGYELLEDKIFFSGDAIPVENDIPIYINVQKSMETLDHILKLKDLQMICPAWDKIYVENDMLDAIYQGKQWIERIDSYVKEANQEYLPLDELINVVSQRMGITALLGNPLFKETIKSHI